MFGDDDLLALSGLQHIAYCERQWALIHLEQEWSDSFDTVRGNLFQRCGFSLRAKGQAC